MTIEVGEAVQHKLPGDKHLHTRVLPSGDVKLAVMALASSLSVPKVHVDLLPEDKRRIVNSLPAESRVVAVLGDGYLNSDRP